ncbi:MAG: DNA repair protein RadC [Alistipes sp.]|nr:DNA repair protein RadC [Alistipes sp.]
MDAIRNKLLTRGVGALTDAELLSLIVDDGGVRDEAVQLGERLVADCGSVANLCSMEISRLRMVEGVGLKRAGRIVAAAELGRRVAALQVDDVVTISSSSDAVKIFRPLFEGLQHEECWVLYLTTSNRVIERQRVSQGGVQGTVVDHRLIAKRALELLATQVIMAHNHPSGNAEASSQDIALTNRISEALALFDIRLLDHLIIARNEEFSFRSRGMIK